MISKMSEVEIEKIMNSPILKAQNLNEELLNIEELVCTIDLSSNIRDTVASRSNIYTEMHVFGYCMTEANEQDVMEDAHSIAATYVVDNVV